MRFAVIPVMSLVLLAAGCAKEAQAPAAPPPPPETPLAQLPRVDPATILDHIKTLSADDMEGRAPGTPGEDKAVAYIESQFKQIGLQPGNPDGTYVQKVPLVGITGAGEAAHIQRDRRRFI